MSLLSEKERKTIADKAMKMTDAVDYAVDWTSEAQHAKDQEDFREQLDGAHAVGFRDGVLKAREDCQKRIEQVFEEIDGALNYYEEEFEQRLQGYQDLTDTDKDKRYFRIRYGGKLNGIRHCRGIVLAFKSKYLAKIKEEK